MIQKSTAPKGGKREGVYKNHSLILAIATPMMIMAMKILIVISHGYHDHNPGHQHTTT